MNKLQLQTIKQVLPQCYGYTTPEIERHNGWIKIGYTERANKPTKEENVRDRINEQVSQSHIRYELEWFDDAFYKRTNEPFKDKDFHACLTKNGVERECFDNGRKSEWFKITKNRSKKLFKRFREGECVLNPSIISEYTLRKEQEDAVKKTYSHFKSNENNLKFLWNAKPRFGKTLAAYDLCQKLNAKNILIVTNRPSIAKSWYDDYANFLGEETGYHFVSLIDELNRNCSYAKTFEEYKRIEKEDKKCIEFVSLQRLKGSKYFGGNNDTLKEIKETCWDIVIIDEAHEGINTIRTEEALQNICRTYTLYLSGTPFRAIEDGEFSEEEIFNWTYSDEQKAKQTWNLSNDGENPYADMPQLNMFTYKMSDIIRTQFYSGKDINGKLEDCFFNLNEFFATKNKKFIYEKQVDAFLDALTRQEKFPFSTPELRTELRHTLWVLNRVESVKALAKKLKNHPTFQYFNIISVAGDGTLEDEQEKEKALTKVQREIGRGYPTITLTVGQLTTGVTVPEWTGVLMLNSVESAAAYIQAAFRVQNKWSFKVKKGRNFEYLKKINAYVFDFEPTRSLKIMSEYATKLKKSSEGERDDVQDLLNFFPIYGEDQEGQMVKLKAEEVLTIPYQIKAQEIFNKQFNSRFLFRNLKDISDSDLLIIEDIHDSDKKEKNEKSSKIGLDQNGKKVKKRIKNGKNQPDEKSSNVIEKLKSLAQKIPCLLMGYENDQITAENFAEKIPETVFENIVGISKNDFGEIRKKFFDEDVLNVAIQNFLQKKHALRNYLDENQSENIFDYISSLESNLIFTPKKIVKEMVDNLEQENPGCFGDDTKTFIDLHMKSGIYIAEIIKRLFNNPRMIENYPDEQERLEHIFEYQVYGCAPTELHSKIVQNFVLGFNENIKIKKHHLILFDTVLSIKNGTLKEDLDSQFANG